MADALTLVMPLQKRDDITVQDFYDYWLNAHITLPARFPGIDTVFLHTTSFAEQHFPRVPNTTHRPDAADEIHGIPEASFTSLPDLQVFIDAAAVQWEDAANFIGEEIDYRSLGAHTNTAIDRLPEPAPTGFEGHVRHLVFLRKRAAVSVEVARSFVTDSLVPAWSRAEGLLKLRSHLFEAIENTLESPGVRKFKPLERQYQACIEVTFPDVRTQDAFATSAAWRAALTGLESAFEAVHALRATRTFTSKYKGQITFVGARGVAVADVVQKIHAKSQQQAAVQKLFVQDMPHMKHYPADFA